MDKILVSPNPHLHSKTTTAVLMRDVVIALLPAPQQEVVRLRIYEKKSFKEIADITNCSINTALGRMRYATINLRRMAARNKMDLTFVNYD